MSKLISICNNKYLNYSCILLAFTTIVILAYGLSSSKSTDFFRLTTALITIQFSAFFIGSFFGFLFGFPSHDNTQFKDKYQRNSSLKEITSWLTKIIVGVTLVEFKDIFEALNNLILSLSNSLDKNISHSPIIGSLIAIYFVVGFIVFFILSVTTIFEELVTNDKNIEAILSEEKMNPSAVDFLKNNFSDSSEIDAKNKEEILKYVAENSIDKLDAYYTKRLAKFLFLIEEYDSSARAYEVAYEKNSSDKYNLLNSCFIRSKYLKDFDGTNKKLKSLISIEPNFAPAHYNLGCNYYREFLELSETTDSENEYMKKLKSKAVINLEKAFRLDKGLYSEAKKDPALNGIDIDNIFTKIKNQV